MREDKKMEVLLATLPEMVRRRFLYDDVARFSITRSDQALELCALLATLVDPQTAAICDACACVGGNAIFFDSVFAHTTCVELDPIRAACLRSNLLAANPQSFAIPLIPQQREAAATLHTPRCAPCRKAVVVCDDFIRFAEARPHMWYDVVFLDLPWGGVDYKQDAHVELTLGATPLHTLCTAVLAHKCRFVALKVPSNYDAAALDHALVAHAWHKRLERHFPVSVRNNTYWVFLVYEGPDKMCPLTAAASSTASDEGDDDEDVKTMMELVDKYWK